MWNQNSTLSNLPTHLQFSGFSSRFRGYQNLLPIPET
jgi:hypothetical protein